MSAYYNESDPYAAAWLRNLITAGAIAPGEVDERSIEDVKPDETKGFTQCHFFAGIGTWSLALRRSGWPDDQHVWTGSCPCQPFSAAGKGNGFADERHLWPAWHHLARECGPGVVFGEQVASKDGLAWLDLVSSDMEAEGYTFGAVDLCAAGVGAPHIRQRLFFVAERLAYYDGSAVRLEYSERVGPEKAAESHTQKWEREWANTSAGCCNDWSDADWLEGIDGYFRPVEPGTFPLAPRTPSHVGRLRAYGNGIVVDAAQAFIESYAESEQQDLRNRIWLID